MNLEIYDENKFKFIHCNPDKTPKTPGFWPKDNDLKKYDKDTGKEIKNYDWMQPENQITSEVAERLQKTGEMIGVYIPEDIIVIDLDRHDNKPNGLRTFLSIKNEYKLDFDITSKTFCVTTGGNGYHIYLYAGKDHGYTQGEKAPGIDLKTHSGYVIAAGSPGYKVHPNVIDLDEIAELPEKLGLWLDSVNERKQENQKKKPINKAQYTIPLSLLDKILKKLDVKEFDSNDKWYDLIVSAIATAGDSDKVIDTLSSWSMGDSRYPDAEKRIRSFEQDGGITPGTFIHILREHSISQYFIKKILSFNTSIELYENMRDDGEALPFPEPDYDEISDSKNANELFMTCGNTAAATLLGFAIHGYIIWCEADKEFYIFDGNKWNEFYDMFSVVYTILIRLTKFMYAKKKGSDVDNENFIKLVKAINKTHWKHDTMRELQCRDGIYYKNATWDSEKLKETLTTQDGVIDFTNNHIITRKGTREEFRKSYVPYNTDDIIKAGNPVKYNTFLKGLFPDFDTLFTARQSSSMFISGNAKKVFQVYHGGGDNGKSTWIEIEKELLGPKAHTYSTSLILNNRFGDDKLPPEAADFMGKYLLFGSEVQKGKQLSLGKIKNFTGDDTIAATPKYKDQREFRPTWQMILSVNDLPFFDGTDRAFINRLLILPFEKTFVDSENDKKNLISKGFNEKLIDLKIDADKLKTEMRIEFPAIINQKINDYVDLKNNYNGIIKQSDKCKLHKESYIAENNDIENFIVELCEISIDKDYFTSSEDLTEAYKDYTGGGKMSSSFVIRGIMKLRQEVSKKTKIIPAQYHNPEDNTFKDVKIQRRGLTNIRLKTIKELEDEEQEKELQLGLDKKYKDDVPF